ncbi:MAG TPA: LOG family protein [Phycisphaerae bacterium]|nr:LOG family protein [Phycisphaerae bacterium]HUU59982.1 LOG family protein [Phycisphaerae bacterium]
MARSASEVVSVFGSYDPPEGSAEYGTARAVGAKLAALGYTVANGGYGGTMAASARGAKEAGGETIAVPCRIWNTSVNLYTDRCVQTDSLEERIAKLIELGTGGYVVLPGATGTLLELAAVWERMAKGIIVYRPLVCVGAFWRPLIEMMTAVRPEAGRCVALAEGPGQLGEYFPPRR